MTSSFETSNEINRGKANLAVNVFMRVVENVPFGFIIVLDTKALFNLNNNTRKFLSAKKKPENEKKRWQWEEGDYMKKLQNSLSGKRHQENFCQSSTKSIKHYIIIITITITITITIIIIERIKN